MATILKRGNKWQAKVRRKGYPVCSRMFTLRADAEAWARGQETKMDRSVWRDRGSAEATTLYALLERYLLDMVPEQRGAEVAALRVRTLMRDPIAQYCLAALTPLVVAQWRDARLTAGAGGQPR
jgi:hypothetical protein